MSINKARSNRKPAPKRHSRNVYKAGSAKKRVIAMPKLPRFGSLRSFGILLLCVFVGFIAITGVGIGTLWVYKQATTSDYFATKHIDILGNVRLSPDMVKDFAGVHEGDNSLEISIAKVEKALLKTPWVESVSVKRVLPNRFVITLSERMPSFWVKKDDVLFYADEHGKIIAPVETGNFIALPTLEVQAGAEQAVSKLAIYLEDLKSGKLPIEYGAISAFKISNDKGVELYLDDREIRLCLAFDSWKNNLKRLSLTLGDLARRNELSKVREIRATDGNVWVITNA